MMDNPIYICISIPVKPEWVENNTVQEVADYIVSHFEDTVEKGFGGTVSVTLPTS
jgi:hypothetical protein